MLEPIELLTWDSQFFCKQVGRLNIREATALDDSLQYANQQRYEILYIYSPIVIEESLIGKYALLDVGGHITFAKELSGHRPEGTKPMSEIGEYQCDSLTPELLDVAFLSGHMSRFKCDPLLPDGSFKRLYETWLAKTLSNRPQTAIYTYRHESKVAGLITAEWHSSKCTVGLLAVLQSHQGRGIASELINYLARICMANRVDSIEVKTQLSNASARALYLKNSFAERDRSFVYHAHNLG
jgi:ribosomal protein S18 acetylase RimI-like enzyme